MPKLENVDFTYHSSVNTDTARAEGLSKSLPNESTHLPVFRYVIIIILAIVLIRTLTGVSTGTISFQGFLDTLANTPRIDMSWAYSFRNWQITGSWWPFDFFRVFLNTIIALVTTALFLAMGVIQGILFCVYFLGFIFA